MHSCFKWTCNATENTPKVARAQKRGCSRFLLCCSNGMRCYGTSTKPRLLFRQTNWLGVLVSGLLSLTVCRYSSVRLGFGSSLTFDRLTDVASEKIYGSIWTLIHLSWSDFYISRHCEQTMLIYCYQQFLPRIASDSVFDVEIVFSHTLAVPKEVARILPD